MSSQRNYFGRNPADALLLGTSITCLLVIIEIITSFTLLARRPDFLEMGTETPHNQTSVLIAFLVFVAFLLTVPCCVLALWKIFRNNTFILDVGYVVVGLAACGQLILLSVVVGFCSRYGSCISFSGPPSMPNDEIVVILVVSILIVLVTLCLAFTVFSGGSTINVGLSIAPPQCRPPSRLPPEDVCPRDPGAWDLIMAIQYVIYVILFVVFVIAVLHLPIVASILNSHTHLTSPVSRSTAVSYIITFTIGVMLYAFVPAMSIAIMKLFAPGDGMWYIAAAGFGIGMIGALMAFIIETIVIADCAHYNSCAVGAPNSSHVAFVWLYVLEIIALVLLIIAFGLTVYLSVRAYRRPLREMRP